MANRMFFFIALPGTIICFIAFSFVVFTPRYVEYKADTTKLGAGDSVSNHRHGIVQNCTQHVNMTKVDSGKKDDPKTKNLDESVKAGKLVYGKWDCSLLDWKILTNQIFLAFLSTTAVAWFTLLGAFFVSLIKIILDWVPHDKIKAARILCSRNFGLGLMSAHITAGGFIIASVVCMVVLWKLTMASKGWVLGINIFIALGVAVLSFITAIMWFMDVRKMGLVPI